MLWKNYRFLLLLGFATPGWLGACGATDRQALLERDLRDLQDQVEELKRSRTEQRNRLDELSNKVIILQDRLETEQLALRPYNRTPGMLPVVRVEADQDEGGGSYSVIGSAPAVRTRDPGPRPAPAAAPRRPFRVETANHAGIDPGDRLPTAAVPPPPLLNSPERVAEPTSAPSGAEGAPRSPEATLTASVASRSIPQDATRGALGPGLTDGGLALPTTASQDSRGPGSGSPTLSPENPVQPQADPAISTGAATPVPGPGSKRVLEPPLPLPDDGPPPRPLADPQQEYKVAYRLFQTGKYGQAQAVFQRFIQSNPRHDLADNCLFWLGEISYKLRRYDEAIQIYNNVIEKFPTGNKVSDAFLKIGLSYLNQNKDDAARKILQQVRTIFPDSPAAQIAISHLELL